MKTQLLKASLLAAVFCLSFASCKKDDASPAVSDDEAANAVGEMISTDFSGTATDASVTSEADANQANGRIALNGRAQSSSCGVLKDSTITKTSLTGALITYTRTADFAYTLTCNGVIPNSLNMTFTGSSTRTGIKVDAAGASTGSFAVTGFEANEANYTLNGTFDRTETITEIVGTKTFTGTHTLTVADVLISKSTKEIKGGSATYTMTGVTGNGTTYSHSGTITFLGSGSATITVNGNNYTVNLLTGTVTAS